MANTAPAGRGVTVLPLAADTEEMLDSIRTRGVERCLSRQWMLNTSRDVIADAVGVIGQHTLAGVGTHLYWTNAKIADPGNARQARRWCSRHIADTVGNYNAPPLQTEDLRHAKIQEVVGWLPRRAPGIATGVHRAERMQLTVRNVTEIAAQIGPGSSTLTSVVAPRKALRGTHGIVQRAGGTRQRKAGGNRRSLCGRESLSQHRRSDRHKQ